MQKWQRRVQRRESMVDSACSVSVVVVFADLFIELREVSFKGRRSGDTTVAAY